MKQKIYILGLINALIIFLGAFFKVNHYPGAALMLIAGIFLLVFVFLPAALINHYRVEGNSRNRILYIVTWLTCFVIFTGMLFKILHWPGAGYAILIALPFPYVIFLPVFLVVTGRNKNFSIYNTVYVLFLLTAVSAFSVLLGLNVTRLRIDDSLNLSRNYTSAAKVLIQLPEANPQSVVTLKINEVLNIVKDYREIILKEAGMTPGEWIKNPADLSKPESSDIAPKALFKAGGKPVGIKLDEGVKALLKLMEKSPGYNDIVKVAPDILGFVVTKEGKTAWFGPNLQVNNLSWALISLDALEYNLRTIKSTLPAD